MKKHYLLSMLLLCVVALLPHGLKAGFIVTHVNSFGKYNFSEKHFCILTNMEGIPSDDVEFKEYAKYISYAFQMRGGIEVAPESDEVEICILLSYDIKDASYIRTISEPVWGNTSVSSVTAKTNSRGTTTYDYHYNRGIVNYKQSQQLVNKYIRYIDLFAYEVSLDNKDNQRLVWKAYAKSEGSGDNLFSIIPYMALSLHYTIGRTQADFRHTVPSSFWDDNTFYYLIVDMFKNGYFCGKGKTFEPYVENGDHHWFKNDDFKLVAVIKGGKETAVLLRASPVYKLPRNTYILWNGEEFSCTKATNYFFEEITPWKRCWANCLILYFHPLPDEADKIDLISQCKKERTKKDLVWKGIHLKQQAILNEQ